MDAHDPDPAASADADGSGPDSDGSGPDSDGSDAAGPAADRPVPNDREGDDSPPAALVETVRARGHEHVTGEHTSTWELTSDDWLTPAGDCILGIEADRTPADFGDAFVAACRDAEATVTATLRVDESDETREAVVTGRGDPELTFGSDRSLVARTSTYVDDRTVMVDADAAAADLDRALVAALADGAEAVCELRVTPPGSE